MEHSEFAYLVNCSKCRGALEENRIGKQAYCRACQAEVMRKTRPKYDELSPEQKQKANTRAYAKVYLRRGKLTKKPCVICGDVNTQMHHENYSKPLEVIWMCRKCHLDHHYQEQAKIVAAESQRTGSYVPFHFSKSSETT